jgi:hypothetical protein
MSAIRFQSGAIWGLQVVKFTLTYEGPLPSGGNKRHNADKWRIRKAIHPQLVDLWTSHPALAYVNANRFFPKTSGVTLKQTHHLYPHPEQPSQPEGWDCVNYIDLCHPLLKHGVHFNPLVRDTFALHCGLRVSFLRKERPGRVYQGGDIDGRIKTLLDALSMPQHAEQVLKDESTPDPFYVLLEDDSMISGLQVESERLLTQEDLPNDYAKLMIEVDVRVRQTTMYNQSFLG